MSDWYELEAVPTMTLQEFAEREGLQMVVTERRLAEGDSGRYYARFKDAEVMERGCLASVYGNGATPEQAIANYAPEISMKRLAIAAYSDSRREITVPRLKGGSNA